MPENCQDLVPSTARPRVPPRAFTSTTSDDGMMEEDRDADMAPPALQPAS